MWLVDAYPIDECIRQEVVKFSQLSNGQLVADLRHDVGLAVVGDEPSWLVGDMQEESGEKMLVGR